MRKTSLLFFSAAPLLLTLSSAVSSASAQEAAPPGGAVALKNRLRLGISVKSTSPIVIDEILPGSLGAQAGLRIGDQITEFNHRKVSSNQDLIAMLRSRMGTHSAITVMRGGKALHLTLSVPGQRAAAPAPAPAAPSAPVKTVSLPKLSPRPGIIRGRAVFEDGRPIPQFSVYAAGVAGSGRVDGKNGSYQMPMQRGLLMSEVSATTTLSYRGQQWPMTLHPLDGLGNGYEANKFRGNTSQGIVRDFVLKMEGTAPAAPAGENADYSVDDQGHSYRYGGWLYGGCTYGKAGMYDLQTAPWTVFPKNSKITLTLVPTGPRLDGSPGRKVVRTFPMGKVVNVYGIPIGVYTATAQLREPNGQLHTLRMCLEMPGKASDWKSSVPIEWKVLYGTVSATRLFFVE